MDVVERFESALGRSVQWQRLWQGSRRPRLRFVRQQSSTDCGAAALAMVLGYYGKHVELDALRQAVAAGRDGSDAAAILAAARRFGLRSRGIRVDLPDLGKLPPASILFWEFRHYVVFDRSGADWVDIVDPAKGVRRVPIDRFSQSFTGMALLFEPTADFERGGQPGASAGRRLLAALFSQKRLLAHIVSASVLLQILSLATPLFTGLILDRVVPWRNFSLLTLLGVAFAGVAACQAVAELARAHLSLHLRTRLEAQFTVAFLEHLISLPYGFFQTRTTGDLIMRLNSNNTVREVVTSAAISAVLDGTLVFVYLLLLFMASPPLAVTALVLAMIRVALYAAFRGPQRRLMGEELESQARLQSYQVEMLDGIEVVKSMGVEHHASERWTNLFVEALCVSVSRGRLDASFSTLLNVVTTSSTLIILGQGAYLVLLGKMTAGTMMALTALASSFLTPLSKLVQTAQQFQLLDSYMERIRDVLDTPAEEGLHATGAAPALPVQGDVRVRNLSFQFGPTSPLVVRDMSFSVPAGSAIALVGGTGCGKSTLARLLAGLYNPAAGAVLYDGIDLKSLDRRHIRNQLGFVTQQTYLFAGSIRQNISLADPGISLDRVIAAAKSACIHEEIASMPMGYDTVLSDRGLSLSGGQRQRLALARALVRKPKVLILDEATSALDALTEARVSERLDELRCTRIIIAHRLSTIQRADRILVLHGGSIVEQGTHEELLECHGTYRQLVAGQMGCPVT